MDRLSNSENTNRLTQRRLRIVRGMFISSLLSLTPLVIANQSIESAPEPQIVSDDIPSASDAVSTGVAPTTSSTLPPSVRYSENVTQFSPVIEKAAQVHGVDPCLVGAITERESGGNVYVEYGGTYGLMQLHPDTAAAMANEYDIAYDGDLYDPQTQFSIGAAIVSEAEQNTGIDTNSVLNSSQLSHISVYYHGIGYYQQLQQGRSLPEHVIEAASRLERIYDENCRN